MEMTVRLRDDQISALERLAERDGVTVHDLVLRAIEAYLARPAAV